MKNIIVYGSRFGQFYLEALKRMKGIKIVGLLAKGSDRSYECARYYNIPLYTSYPILQVVVSNCFPSKSWGKRTGLKDRQLV